MLQDPSCWFVVAFILFLILLGRRAFLALRTMLDQYAAGIKTDMNAAQQRKELTETTLAEAKDQYAKAESMATAILEHAGVEADRLHTEAAIELERFLASREKAVDERIKNTEAKVLHEVCAQAIMLSSKAAQKLLSQHMAPEKGLEYIDRALDELESDVSLLTAIKGQLR